VRDDDGAAWAEPANAALRRRSREHRTQLACRLLAYRGNDLRPVEEPGPLIGRHAVLHIWIFQHVAQRPASAALPNDIPRDVVDAAGTPAEDRQWAERTRSSIPHQPSPDRSERAAGARLRFAPRRLIHPCGPGRMTVAVRCLFSTRRFGRHGQNTVPDVPGARHGGAAPCSADSDPTSDYDPDETRWGQAAISLRAGVGDRGDTRSERTSDVGYSRTVESPPPGRC
jgi:hypothetical protein